MPFFRIEHRYGDSNDCSVSEGFVESPTQEAALSALDAYIKERLKERHFYCDHTEDDVCVMYYPTDACSDGEECRDRACVLDHRAFHSTFRIIGTEEAEPDSALSRFHAWDGEITQAHA